MGWSSKFSVAWITEFQQRQFSGAVQRLFWVVFVYLQKICGKKIPGKTPRCQVNFSSWPIRDPFSARWFGFTYLIFLRISWVIHHQHLDFPLGLLGSRIRISGIFPQYTPFVSRLVKNPLKLTIDPKFGLGTSGQRIEFNSPLWVDRGESSSEQRSKPLLVGLYRGLYYSVRKRDRKKWTILKGSLEKNQYNGIWQGFWSSGRQSFVPPKEPCQFDFVKSVVSSLKNSSTQIGSRLESPEVWKS